MANRKRKSVFRTPSGERTLIVRILAIVVVVIIIAALIFTMMPTYLFADTDVMTIGEDERNPDGTLPLVIDGANILTDDEEAELNAGLNIFRESDAFDIVVLTVNSIGGLESEDYADIFYDENGYGGGSDHDGAIILVSMENSDWAVTTSGYGNIAITDQALYSIEEEVLPLLSSGRYCDAFKSFGDGCAYYVREAKANNITDTNGSESERSDYPVATNLGISGVIGIIVSWFTNGRKKAELKTVRYKNQAKDYIRKDSLTLNEKRDRFLFASTSVMPIGSIQSDINNNSGEAGAGGTAGTMFSGGTTVHQSPTGNMHGGHSGKF